MTPQSHNPHELLAWYAEAGIDCALLDEPVDRFAQAENEARARKSQANRGAVPSPTANAGELPRQRMAAPPVQRGPAQAVSVPDGNAVARAQTLAAEASTLQELRKAVEGFDGCNLKFTARTTVFCDGHPQARLMLVGEVPDRDEDEQGLPFVGKSGRLLEKMLTAIGLDRSSVYLTTILPWRPPGNRTPSVAETDICRPFVERHIELARPDLLLVFGGFSSQTLLRSNSDILSLRGKWASVQIGETAIPTLPTLSPGYLLKIPAHNRLAWNDLLALQSKMQEPAAGG